MTRFSRVRLFAPPLAVSYTEVIVSICAIPISNGSGGTTTNVEPRILTTHVPEVLVCFLK